MPSLTLITRLKELPAQFQEALAVFTTKPEVSQRMLSAFALYTTYFGRPESVMYPCPNIDITPRHAFPEAQVTFIDSMPFSVKVLKRAGAHAICADATTYQPKKQSELLIILSPTAGITTESLAHLVRTRGNIIANDWHGNATEMMRKPDSYRLRGFIDENTLRYSTNRVEARNALKKDDGDFPIPCLFIFEKNY